jgi:hypothetical protein
MFDLTKIKTKYVWFDFSQNEHYVGHVTYVTFVPNLFDSTNITNVIKIGHLDMIDYDYNVTFHDVTILK